MTKKILQSFILIILSLTFIFLILELFLRFIMGDVPRNNLGLKQKNQPIPFVEDKEMGWKPKPGEYLFAPWSEEGKTTKLTILNDGSRLNDHEDYKKKEKIIFIGGSLTQGQAVNDNETFPWLLQKKIKSYKIKNYGVGGYGGTQSFLKLKSIFNEQTNIRLVLYGFIPHHEIRNIAAGSWMYLLNKNSRGIEGKLSLPYASLENGNIKIHKPKKYFELPLGNKSALVAKIEKRILKIDSFKRSLQKTEISKKIVLDMNKISKDNGAKFIFLFLNVNELPSKQFDTYDKFLKENNIEYIKCQFPKGKNYTVKGEGHPNKDGHDSISNCIYNKLSLALDKL